MQPTALVRRCAPRLMPDVRPIRDMSGITSLRYLRELERAIEGGGERDVHACLKRYQRPLWVAFSHGWNAIMVVPEFRFGRRYRADFLVLSSHSGALHATMVELESSSVRLYTNAGTESRALTAGLRQVKDWNAWVSDFPDQFRREVAEEIERASKGDRRVSRSTRNVLRAELLDYRTALLSHFAIVIGRRGSLSVEDAQRRGNESRWRLGLEIATYDRLIEIGKSDEQRRAENRAVTLARPNQRLHRPAA